MYIGFPGLLALVFITLRLTGVIAWGWVWVLAPIWMSAAIWIVTAATLILGLLIKDLLEHNRRKKRRKAETRG